MRTMMMRTRTAAVTVTGLVCLTLAAIGSDHITRQAEADDRGPGIVPVTVMADGRGPGIIAEAAPADDRGPGIIIETPTDDRGPGNPGV